jgi:hypothetical protein
VCKYVRVASIFDENESTGQHGELILPLPPPPPSRKGSEIKSTSRFYSTHGLFSFGK